MLAAFPEAVGSVDRVNGWEAGLRDGLGYIHDILRSWAEQEPYQAVIHLEECFLWCICKSW